MYEKCGMRIDQDESHSDKLRGLWNIWRDVVDWIQNRRGFHHVFFHLILILIKQKVNARDI